MVAGGGAGAGLRLSARPRAFADPSLSNSVCVPLFIFQRPRLFSTQSPADVRPRRWHGSPAALRQRAAAASCSPQITCQPRAASPSLPARPTHAELRLWRLGGTGCVFACRMAPASLTGGCWPRSDHGVVPTRSGSSGAPLESRAAKQPRA